VPDYNLVAREARGPRMVLDSCKLERPVFLCMNLYIVYISQGVRPNVIYCDVTKHFVFPGNMVYYHVLFMKS